MANGSNVTKDELLKLSDERQSLETELATYLDILNTQEVGMDDAMVDAEGFPRNDIDVHQVRIARNKIICLRNDLKDIMSRIEDGLHNIHAQSRDGLGITNALATTSITTIPDCFAKIDEVSVDSPAATAGMKLGDHVAEFGTITAANFTNLQQVGQLVQGFKDQNVRIKVVRNGQLLPLVLRPQAWSGRGLLGCHIIPLDQTVDR